MKFCTAAEMRRLDEKTITECGLPGVVLMENAGRGASLLCREFFGGLAGKKVAVVCGRGNNGGDGFVMGRIFYGWGADVRFFLLSSKEKVAGDARTNLDVARKMSLEIVEVPDEAALERLVLHGVDLVVDAIFGTGLSAEVRGHYRGAIERINAANKPVVAVDIPSGLDSDTGRVLGVAVRADLTVTFGLPKVGLLVQPGETLSGRVEVVDIGIPPHVLLEADPRKELLDDDSLRGLMPARKPDSHKGSFGHALIVAGSTGKTGAAAMAAMATVRSGAGLVTLAVPAGLNAILEQKVTEAMTEPLAEEFPGFMAAEAVDRILELSSGKNVLALGPGLGTRSGARDVVHQVIERSETPLVIDADGINVLTGFLEILKKARRDVVLTPHPGEMSRLTGLDASAIQADRLGTAGKFAREYGVILVLKGRRTVVAAPDGRLFMNTSGGPHMASGGMGDILTGIITGLIAQGLSPLDAARLGVYAHGRAADSAADLLGPIGLAATDLLDELPGLWPEFTA